MPFNIPVYGQGACRESDVPGEQAELNTHAIQGLKKDRRTKNLFNDQA